MNFPGYVDAEGLYGRHGFKALDFKASELTEGVPIAGRNVLEIGAGAGVLSLWALHKGARSVVSLEPEADGSTNGVAARARKHRERLGIPESQWEYRPDTVQTYKPDRRFGVILSQASINHLDEDACVRLAEDAECQRRYRTVFGQLHEWLEPGGHFVFTDVGRWNAWNKAGLASPWAPEIEWHKHQEPETWARLLEECGFETVRISFQHPFYRLRSLGPLLSTRLASRFLGSQFAVTTRRK